MSKIAFIYPGQGAQKAGMGADFYEKSEIAKHIFNQAGEELDLDMKALCFEENEKLDLTEYTQAAMVTTCLAMTRVAESKGLKADITAGLSLGEYPAIAVAGGMNDMDAVRLVRQRGILMQNTVPAGEKLAEELDRIRFHELKIPYVTNVSAEKVTDIKETSGLLTKQISSPVRWMQSMEHMIADGVDTFVEIGPGRTLEGFLRKIDRSVNVFHISQWEDVDKVCAELAESGNVMEEA